MSEFKNSIPDTVNDFQFSDIFKLEEIQQKFSVLKKGGRVMDVGSSPGSWSLYIIDRLAGGGSVTGVDLNPPDGKLLARKNYHFILGDFTTDPVMGQIAEVGPFDAVVSDAAPSTTGNRTLDTARSADIARQVLLICEKCLAPGGSCVLKIFQGGEEKDILSRMRSRFSSARAFKPKASRSESMETYFVGLGFNAKLI